MAIVLSEATNPPDPYKVAIGSQLRDIAVLTAGTTERVVRRCGGVIEIGRAPPPTAHIDITRRIKFDRNSLRACAAESSSPDKIAVGVQLHHRGVAPLVSGAVAGHVEEARARIEINGAGEGGCDIDVS